MTSTSLRSRRVEPKPPAQAPAEIRKLTTLLEVSHALSSTLKLKAALHHVLETLERDHGILRSSVSLQDEESGELRVEAFCGPPLDGRRAGSPLGGAITRRVVESGRHVVVPRVSKEPDVLQARPRRHGSDAEELSFICVPILVNRKPAGVLEIDLRFKKDRDYDRAHKFLRVVASMIGQAIKVSRTVEAERQRLLEENSHLRDELRGRHDFSRIVGASSAMQVVYEQVAQVARTNTTVLIRGESGTGKELIAEAIHYNSPRAKKPLVRVSCGALPETLIESELFGYERGAFTGAQARRPGRFELAEGGTLFLDEIGELQPGTQVKLLRVLQQREFERLGGTGTIRANVRVVAATHKDIERAIADGLFREDLYYRLNVFTIFLPPLRERKPDVLALADHFLEKYAREHGKVIKRISTPAIDMLMSYHWPGNVRELENAIERAVLVCEGGVIHGHHLPPTLQTAEASDTVTNVSLDEAVEAYERDLLLDALKTARGNRAKAARLLRTTERIVGYKVRKYAIDCARFRA